MNITENMFYSHHICMNENEPFQPFSHLWVLNLTTLHANCNCLSYNYTANFTLKFSKLELALKDLQFCMFFLTVKDTAT